MAVARVGAAKHAPMIPLPKVVPKSRRHLSLRLVGAVTTVAGVIRKSAVVAVEEETVAEVVVTRRGRLIPTASHQTLALARDSTESHYRWESPRKLNRHPNIRR